MSSGVTSYNIELAVVCQVKSSFSTKEGSGSASATRGIRRLSFNPASGIPRATQTGAEHFWARSTDYEMYAPGAGESPLTGEASYYEKLDSFEIDFSL